MGREVGGLPRGRPCCGPWPHTEPKLLFPTIRDFYRGEKSVQRGFKGQPTLIPVTAWPLAIPSMALNLRLPLKTQKQPREVVVRISTKRMKGTYFAQHLAQGSYLLYG